MSDRESLTRSVYVWVCEGTWRAAVDAALRLAPPGAHFTLLHVTSAEVPDAARGAYAGLLGRRARDPAARLEEVAATGAGELLGAAAARLGRSCDRLELEGRTERVVVSASADADLLIAARDGDQARLGPKSLGRATRFVVDHAACPVLLVWPGTAPGISSVPPHPPTLIPPPTQPVPSPAATSSFPAGSLNRETRTQSATDCSIPITNRNQEGLADVAEMTSEARVVALNRLWPGDVADRGGDLLDAVFGWADFSMLRRLVTGQCAAAGLTGSRLDDFVLAVHEIAANAIVHAGAGGRLILRRAASGLRCLGLWLAATLADELSITSGPDSTIVSLYMRLD